MSPPLSSSSPPSCCLRLATYNIGLGFSNKISRILARCIDLSLDIIALQEIGDPALTRTLHSQHHLIVSPGASHHQAGVGLLISVDLAPRVRTYKRSSSGRLVGVVLELRKGHQTLVVSAYMPSGLDHRSHSDEDVKLAHELYRDLIAWTRDMQQVIVMGDLNETLSRFDRYPRPAPSPAGRVTPIRCLVDEGFTDVYRSLYPDARLQSGFTHYIDSLIRRSRSRIDYIWTRGTPAGHLLSCSIDTKLHQLSHHRLLWMEMQLPAGATPTTTRQLYTMKLPNLRGLDEHAQKVFQMDLERRTKPRHHELQTLAQTQTADSLSSLAAELTKLARHSAFRTLPITGAAPGKNKTILQLERQRRDLIRLERITGILVRRRAVMTRCPEWLRLYRHCLAQYDVQWTIDVFYNSDDSAWMTETRGHINATRLLIRKETHRLKSSRKGGFDESPAAMIHRMIQSDALPAQLYSVIDSRGELTSNPEELEDVMVQHFESVFAIPPLDPAPLDPPPPPMLFDKPDIDTSWYSGLMVDVTDAELLAVIKDVRLVSAPGQDDVSSGVWKLALQGSESMRAHVTELFTTCLRTSMFPSAWKTGVIIPFVKDAQKDRTMSNIRPISLQSCLGKLLTKLLAHRLASILQRHPILNASQRGFILGGTTMKCIDELLDAWDWSRANNAELHTLFYDIKQAYDSVQTHVLIRALHRIHLPPKFIALVADSLAGLTSCIRTSYGLTRLFGVHRSLRQGDPLAPLLFVILMDGLHDGLALNPFTNASHGCRLRLKDGVIEVSSLGYADDTGILTNSLPDLKLQNDWVQYFMRFNLMRLNGLKCELVGRKSDGTALTAGDVAVLNINVDDVALTPLAHDKPIRYLGLHITFDGSCKEQQNKSRSMIMTFTRLAIKFRLSVKQTVYMFNVFLITRLELALHYIHGPGTSDWVKQCDRLLIGCIRHIVGSPIRLSHSAVALIIHLILPSWLEPSIKVSELFFRANSSDTRWAELGRVIMRSAGLSTVDVNSSLPHQNNGSRSARAAHLALHKLRWNLFLRGVRDAGDRHPHVYDTLAAPDVPIANSVECSVVRRVRFAEGPSDIAHDAWAGWLIVPSLRDVIHVFTDGTFDPASNTSAWSVVLGDEWFDANFANVPSDEQLVQPTDVDGATLTGGIITCTRGIYPAELQAIARTLAMLPLGCKLHIHSDSQSSITAIEKFDSEMNERRRFRMSGRPLLDLIRSLLRRRRAQGGTAEFTHVPAHTTKMDRDSVGNRLADYQATLSRRKPDRSSPFGLRQLPLAQLEQYLHIVDTSNPRDGRVVIDDPRSVARQLMKANAFQHWKDKPESDPQHRFACQGAIDLGKATLAHGTDSQQQTLVHAASNSIQFHWVDGLDGKAKVEQLVCAACRQMMDIAHLANCPAPPSVAFRDRLHVAIVDLFKAFPECDVWCRNSTPARISLEQLLLSLFPLSVSASTVEDVRDHTARGIFGAVTRAECQAGVGEIGIKDRKEGVKTFLQYRLLCLDHIESFFSKLKNP